MSGHCIHRHDGGLCLLVLEQRFNPLVSGHCIHPGFIARKRCRRERVSIPSCRGTAFTWWAFDDGGLDPPQVSIPSCRGTAFTIVTQRDKKRPEESFNPLVSGHCIHRGCSLPSIPSLSSVSIPSCRGTAFTALGGKRPDSGTSFNPLVSGHCIHPP